MNGSITTRSRARKSASRILLGRSVGHRTILVGFNPKEFTSRSRMLVYVEQNKEAKNVIANGDLICSLGDE